MPAGSKFLSLTLPISSCVYKNNYGLSVYYVLSHTVVRRCMYKCCSSHIVISKLKCYLLRKVYVLIITSNKPFIFSRKIFHTVTAFPDSHSTTTHLPTSS